MKTTLLAFLCCRPSQLSKTPTAEPAVTWHNLSKLNVEGNGWSKTKQPGYSASMAKILSTERIQPILVSSEWRRTSLPS